MSPSKSAGLPMVVRPSEMNDGRHDDIAANRTFVFPSNRTRSTRIGASRRRVIVALSRSIDIGLPTRVQARGDQGHMRAIGPWLSPQTTIFLRDSRVLPGKATLAAKCQRASRRDARS